MFTFLNFTEEVCSILEKRSHYKRYKIPQATMKELKKWLLRDYLRNEKLARIKGVYKGREVVLISPHTVKENLNINIFIEGLFEISLSYTPDNEEIEVKKFPFYSLYRSLFSIPAHSSPRFQRFLNSKEANYYFKTLPLTPSEVVFR